MVEGIVEQTFDIKLYEKGDSCHSHIVSELPPPQGLPMGADDVPVFHIYPLTLVFLISYFGFSDFFD